MIKKKVVVAKKPSSKPFEKGVTLYVGGLRYDKDEEGVIRFFKTFGYVESVEMIKDKQTKMPKGIAFVKMKRESEGLMAVKGLDGKIIEGRTLKVSVANQREEFKKPIREKIEKASDKPAKKSTKEENIYKAKVKKDKKVGLSVLFKHKAKK